MFRWLSLVIATTIAAVCPVLHAEEKQGGAVPDWTWSHNVAESAADMQFPAWIWVHSDGERALDMRYFSKTVTVPQDAIVERAWLRISVDNAYHLYVNGQYVGSDEWWQSVEYWDVTGLIRPGDNTISLKAWDFGGAAGVYLFGGIVTADGAVIPLKTDDSWRCTLDPDDDWLTTSSGRNSVNARIVQEGVAPDTTVIDWSRDHVENIAALLRLHLDQPVRSLLPIPQQLRDLNLSAPLPYAVAITASAPESKFAAAELLGVLAELDSGFHAGPGGIAIEFVTTALPDQAYRIQPSFDGATWRIEAGSKAGFIYATWTFLQMVYRENGQYFIRAAAIDDYPDVLLRGIVDGQLTPDMFDWMSFYKINAVKLYMNYAIKPDPVLAKLREYAENRGIHVIPSLHPPTLFRFQPGSDDMRHLMTRIGEIRDLGFREICILQDDYPNETAGKDVETYGPGIEGLIHAQSYMMKEIHREYSKDFDRIIFMPRVYFDPTVLGLPPATEAAPGHLYYREKLGDISMFPADIEGYTTRANPDYTAKLRQITKRKSHVFQNYNEAALAAFHVHFEPYPVVDRRMLDDISGLWLNGADTPMPFSYWHVNYLTFAENTWNIAKPIGLAPAFAEKYGREYAPMLCRYAELMGGHAAITGTMEEFWWLPPEFATRTLMKEINLASPDENDLKRFALKAGMCRDASQLIMASTLPDAAKKELAGTALRLAHMYEIKIAVEKVRDLVSQMESLPMERRAALAARAEALIAEALPKARTSQEIIRSMRLFYTAIVPDYSNAGQLKSLADEVKSALNNVNCVLNGSFEIMQFDPKGNITELPGWRVQPVKDGMVQKGDVTAASGKRCLALRSNNAGDTDSSGRIVSDAFVATGNSLEWAHATQNAGKTAVTVRILDAQRGELVRQEFLPSGSAFEMARMDISAFNGQTIRLEFSGATRDQGLGWLTWIDGVAIR